jgi:hypothetical protein
LIRLRPTNQHAPAPITKETKILDIERHEFAALSHRVIPHRKMRTLAIRANAVADGNQKTLDFVSPQGFGLPLTARWQLLETRGPT